MIYLLDTNTCVRYLNGRSPEVLARVQATPVRDIATCSVVKAELYYGAQRSQNRDKTLAVQNEFLNQFVSLPFDDQASEVYARIRAELEAQGTPIGPNDLMIAAIALAHQLTLVTHNTREFGRITGLSNEDWESPPPA